MPGELGILKIGEWELMGRCRMVWRKSKEPIKDKIVYRAQEFTQLHGRRIYRETESRVRNNLRAKIFSELRCTILSVEENKIFRAQKRCSKSRFYQEM